MRQLGSRRHQRALASAAEDQRASHVSPEICRRPAMGASETSTGEASQMELVEHKPSVEDSVQSPSPPPTNKKSKYVCISYAHLRTPYSIGFFVKEAGPGLPVAAPGKLLRGRRELRLAALSGALKGCPKGLIVGGFGFRAFKPHSAL